MKKTLLKLQTQIAEIRGHKYFGIIVGLPANQHEYTIMHAEALDHKVAYWDNVYTEDLHLIANPDIRIVAFASGDDLAGLCAELDLQYRMKLTRADRN